MENWIEITHEFTKSRDYHARWEWCFINLKKESYFIDIVLMLGGFCAIFRFASESDAALFKLIS